MALVVGALGACTATPGRAPDVEDDRACPHSNAELTRVLDHFALQLPSSATDVRFSSDVHPLFGELFVELRFSMPRGEVTSFLAAAERSREESRDAAAFSPPDACLGLGSFAPTSVIADYGPASSLREFALDDGQGPTSVVYVRAMDHP